MFQLILPTNLFLLQAAKRTPTPEEITFHLLHLSLLREYLDYEFQELRPLPFYNVENIIDDWVLMGFLVGNDFIPHLPNMHINKGALPELYAAYKVSRLGSSGQCACRGVLKITERRSGVHVPLLPCIHKLNLGYWNFTEKALILKCLLHIWFLDSTD